ncbi:hypothetical protein HanRHA438_Chr00c55g0859271 [Helianthus annuus]|nr:hypothetical protein HanRHA438_Chr00c55g0859271 [Helianthus annuus]
MVSDKTQGWSGDSFDRYMEYKYDVEKSFNLWRSAEGESLNPADCMQQLLEQVRRHRVNIDGNVCTVIVTTLVLEECSQSGSPVSTKLRAKLLTKGRLLTTVLGNDKPKSAGLGGLVSAGWQRKLDPEYDVIHTLQNLLFKTDLVEDLFYTIEGLMAP